MENSSARSRFRPLDEIHAGQGSAGGGENGETSEPTGLRRLSGCIPNRPARQSASLTNHQIGSLLAPIALALVLGIGHVHLRFTVEDLQTQHVQLQGLRRSLVRQVATLERDKSLHWEPARLAEALRRSSREYVELRPAWIATAVVPETLRRKYLDSGPAEAAMADAARKEEEKAGRLVGLMRLLEAGKAYAAGQQ